MLMHVDAAAAYVATQVLFQLTCVTPSAMVAMAHCCRQLMLQLRVVAVELHHTMLVPLMLLLLYAARQSCCHARQLLLLLHMLNGITPSCSHMEW